MAAPKEIVSHIHVQINGNDLNANARGRLLEVTVDQHVHLPAMFTVRLYDPDMELLDGGLFDLTKPIAVSSQTADGKKVPLIEGEITALEPDFGKGMIAELTVRGYDKSHRLYRERRSETYLNVKDSDLASEIARKVGLTAQVDATATVYEHLYQHNQSDLAFLRQRARRIGYECFVTGKNLYFRQPTSSQPSITVAWGRDLIAFRPRVAVAEQVGDVWVKGWDVQKKGAIVGQADQGTLYPKIKDTQDGKAWSQKLGTSRMVIVDHPVVSQAEADILAAARLNELSGTFIEAEGEAFRRPDIQAGEIIQIDGLGKRLSGAYMVTRARHVYTDAGLKTYFHVTGLRTGLLMDELNRNGAGERWPGVVTAIVTNTDDPNGWGRVKVKYPWMSDEEESGWARLIGQGAGPACGMAAIPAVDDEVMVAFQHGDFDYPVVLGGVWNGQDALPAQVHDAPEGEKPLVRSWTSRTGHRITIFDNDENKIAIETASGHQLFLDDANKTISITSSGGLEIVMDDNGSKILLNSGGDIEVAASSNLTMKGMNVTVEASGNMDLQASGQVTVKGAVINLN